MLLEGAVRSKEVGGLWESRGGRGRPRTRCWTVSRNKDERGVTLPDREQSTTPRRRKTSGPTRSWERVDTRAPAVSVVFRRRTPTQQGRFRPSLTNRKSAGVDPDTLSGEGRTQTHKAIRAETLHDHLRGGSGRVDDTTISRKKRGQMCQSSGNAGRAPKQTGRQKILRRKTKAGRLVS